MIYNILVIIFICLLSSCSSVPKKILLTKDQDVLSNESLSRSFELSTKNEASAIKRCHSNDIEGGLKILAKNLDKDKNTFDYWNQLGTCYYLNSEFSKALLYFDIGSGYAKSNKQKAMLLNNTALVHIKESSPKTAYSILSQAIKLYPHSKTIQMNLASLHLYANNKGLATKYLKNLERINRLDPDIKRKIGSLNE